MQETCHNTNHSTGFNTLQYISCRRIGASRRDLTGSWFVLDITSIRICLLFSVWRISEDPSCTPTSTRNQSHSGTRKCWLSVSVLCADIWTYLFFVKTLCALIESVAQGENVLARPCVVVDQAKNNTVSEMFWFWALLARFDLSQEMCVTSCLKRQCVST